MSERKLRDKWKHFYVMEENNAVFTSGLWLFIFCSGCVKENEIILQGHDDGGETLVDGIRFDEVVH